MSDDLSHSGWITKRGSMVKSWKRRYFVLTPEGVLQYMAGEKDIKKAPLGKIDMRECEKIRPSAECTWKDSPKDLLPGSSFELSVNGRVYCLYCDSPALATVWINKLNLVRELLAPFTKKAADAASADSAPSEEGDTRRSTLQSGLSESSITFLSSQVAIAHQGWLQKAGGRVKNFKKRYFVLSNDGVLSYFNDEKMSSAPLGRVELRLVTSVKNPSQCDWPASETPKEFKLERRFELQTDSRDFRFVADTPEDVQIWLHKLIELKDKVQRAAKRSNPENEGLDLTLLQLVEDESEDEDEAEPEEDDDDDDFSYVDDFFDFFMIPPTSERRHLLAEALRYNRLGTGNLTPFKKRHVTILYNPVSGQGTAKKIVEFNVIPVLRLAGLDFTVVPTQYRGFAKEHVNGLDLSKTNAIIVAGGDGLVSEVITGLMTREDNGYEKIAVGIVPSGTANAMANELDRYKSKSHVQLTSRAALGVASGNTRLVDVVECILEDSKVYGLSCIGWGLAGAVGLQADKLRWLPGQRKARYDIAGFVTMIKDWPVVSRCQFAYLVPKEGDQPQTEWRVSNWGFINFIASNVPKLGVDHPISPEVSIDDGYMVVAMLADNLSRTQVIQAALSMKAGKYLAEHKYVHAVRVKEFKIIPDLNVTSKNNDIPYNIDGDPVTASAVHVRILNKRLRVFQIPEDS